MSSNLVSNRYARALWRVCSGSKEKASSYREVLTLVGQLFEDEDVRRVLVSPVIPKDLKNQVLEYVVTQSGADDALKSFIKGVVDVGRVSILEDLSDSFGALLDASEGLLSANVSSVVELSPSEVEQVKVSLESATKRKVVVTNTTDATLLGGICVQIGNKIIDMSLRSRLERLTRAAIV
tara:strand:- start:173 stop:712 length:540 start_codon:yes stop_codon:yes gene_type:complete